jgi:hypothetical protein
MIAVLFQRRKKKKKRVVQEMNVRLQVVKEKM